MLPFSSSAFHSENLMHLPSVTFTIQATQLTSPHVPLHFGTESPSDLQPKSATQKPHTTIHNSQRVQSSTAQDSHSRHSALLSHPISPLPLHALTIPSMHSHYLLPVRPVQRNRSIQCQRFSQLRPNYFYHSPQPSTHMRDSQHDPVDLQYVIPIYAQTELAAPVGRHKG